MDPIKDRGPAPSFYDPPRPLDAFPCHTCEGTGRIGCTDECWDAPLPNTGVRILKGDALCRREHTCPMCQGTGEMAQSASEERDDRRGDEWDKWEAEREDRLTESD